MQRFARRKINGRGQKNQVVTDTYFMGMEGLTIKRTK
jgi:hypothetical protein